MYEYVKQDKIFYQLTIFLLNIKILHEIKFSKCSAGQQRRIKAGDDCDCWHEMYRVTFSAIVPKSTLCIFSNVN